MPPGRPSRTTAIRQPGAPLAITSLFSRCGRAYLPSAEGTCGSEGVFHSVVWENRGDRTVAAVRLGLVVFDQWKEFASGIDGVSVGALPPGRRGTATWVDPMVAELTHTTVVAYVSKVRFSDDTVWSADLDGILDQLSGSGFVASSLYFAVRESEGGHGLLARPEARREPPAGQTPPGHEEGEESPWVELPGDPEVEPPRP